MKVYIPKARLAFPALFEAKQVNGEGDPKFSATGLIPSGNPDVLITDDAGKFTKKAKLKEVIELVAKEKWAAKAPGYLAEMIKKDRTCFRDGADKAQYDGFDGCWYISASNKARPTVINRDKTPLTAEDGKPYGGCYVAMVVDIWAMDNQYGKRVNATLSMVQFVEDGDAFSGATPTSADDAPDLGDGANPEDVG